MPTTGSQHPVPVRTIATTIAMVLATLLALLLLRRLGHILSLLAVSALFAVVLTPPVDFLCRHGLRRSVATVVVFVVGTTVFAAMIFAFVQPVAREANEFVQGLPRYVEEVKDGRGPVGRLVQRYDVDEWVEENRDRLQQGLRSAGAPALRVVRSVANTVFQVVTILVLTILMVLQAPVFSKGFLNLLDERRREHVRRVGADCAKAVTGYMAGNVVISVIAGLTTFVFLLMAGVPFAGVLALWVAFADLIPLVGATLGAIPTVLVAFAASTGRGVATIVFYVAYQQFENHVLQPTVMSRTVSLNPLTVLVSVLVGVELFGVAGALLAIPVAGVISVVARDLYNERRGTLKGEPTVGADEVPVSEVAADETPGPAATAGEPA